MRSLVLIAALMTLCSCAAVVSRTHANSDQWYPGTKQNWRDLSIDPWYSQSLDLVDLPLSAVADTVLLPWDAIARNDHRGPEPELTPAPVAPAPVPATAAPVAEVETAPQTPVAAPVEPVSQPAAP
jgi:uncharacterized protein YceK